MMMGRLLSVVVPVYNVEPYVLTCLQSVAAQDIVDMEVIVVDDGSTDGSGRLCDEFATTDSRFRVIHQANAGLGAARNVAMEQARGEYLMFVDSDDFLVPGALAPILRLAIECRLDVLGFGSVSVPEDATVAPVGVSPLPADVKPMDGLEYIASHNFATMVWWYVVKREMAQSLPFPVGRMIEDAGYNLQLFLKSHLVAKVPNVAYCYRNRSTSIMHNTDTAHQMKLLGDYLWAAENVARVIRENEDVLHGNSLCRSQSQRNSHVFFGAIRAFKLGRVREYIADARSKGLYPFERMSRSDYPSVVLSIIHRLIHIPWLWNLMSKTYLFICKIQPRHYSGVHHSTAR